MVNFGLNSASLLGIFLAVAGASLYFLRSVRPELARDHDIFFAAVGLLCGFILLFQGWRLDPILQFGQFLLTGTTIFFAVESIRLRGVATEQARRNTPIVDRDRPVSKTRVYTEAELDEIEPYEEQEIDYTKRRLRGYEEPRTSRRGTYDYEQSEPRSSRSRSVEDRYSRDRRSRPSPSPRPEPYETRSERRSGYDDDYSKWDRQDEWNEPQSPSSRRSRPSSPNRRPVESNNRPPSRRISNPAEELGRSYEDDTDIVASDYVDYQPIDPQEERDWESNSERFSEGEPNLPEEEQNRGKPIDFDY